MVSDKWGSEMEMARPSRREGARLFIPILVDRKRGWPHGVEEESQQQGKRERTMFHKIWEKPLFSNWGGRKNKSA